MVLLAGLAVIPAVALAEVLLAGVVRIVALAAAVPVVAALLTVMAAARMTGGGMATGAQRVTTDRPVVPAIKLIGRQGHA